MKNQETKDMQDERGHTSNAAVEDSGVGESERRASGGEESAESSAPVEPDAEKIARLEENLARARADYLNLQRRVTAERADAILYANAELMKLLVSVLDDFDRALSSADSSENLKAVVDGVRLVHDNLQRALSGAGLEIIDPLHQPFDPSVHEALMRRPTEEHHAGTVVEVVGKGYKLRDRVIRPARVIVAAPPEEGQPAAE